MTNTQIETLGKDTDKLIVQKSRPLFALGRSELTLAEFKILDTYLSRINSKKTTQRAVVFSKGELEELLGVKKINTADLKQRLKNLYGPIDIGDDKKKIHLVGLFEECYAEQDEYGLWKVNLECTEKAMKYIFNIENLGYLRYKLYCITSLKSRQAYLMFIYLEDNKFRTPFKVELQELKEILKCEKEETYKEFKHFNNLVLKKIHKELNEKTECKYDYEPIKKGRSVIGIEFKLYTIPKIECDDIDPMTIEQCEKDTKPLWMKPLEDLGLTAEQEDELRAVFVTVPKEKLPESSASSGNIDLRRYHYMDIKAKELARRNSDNHIKNKFSYILKMVKQDQKIEV